jgi:integrase/recombinase XerD
VAARIIGKGNKERVLKLPAELVDRCRETFGGSQWLLETSGGRPYRREYVSNQIKRAGERVLGRHISAHTLRHSFASLKIARTGKIKAVSEYLGHSTTSITLDMYVHESLDMNDLSAGW